MRSLREYVAFTRYQQRGDPVGYFREGSLNPFQWHWRFLSRAIPLGKQPPPDSLLTTQFNSLTAYKLGPGQNMKFRAQPVACESGPPLNVEGVSQLCRVWPSGAPEFLGCDSNLLRDTMAQEIAGAAACFDFMVQPQVHGKNMPVEDPTVEWSEDESPFVPVARIEIPPQEFSTQEQDNYCESLAFNPWHSLPAHRPLGAMNRVRKAVYVEISRYRRAKKHGQRSTRDHGLSGRHEVFLGVFGETDGMVPGRRRPRGVRPVGAAGANVGAGLVTGCEKIGDSPLRAG